MKNINIQRKMLQSGDTQSLTKYLISLGRVLGIIISGLLLTAQIYNYLYLNFIDRKLFMGGNSHSNMSSPVVVKASGKHTATVIFMHGLGDTGHGWASALSELKLPHIKFICPTAPAQPVTLNAGMRMPAWFDIFGLEGSSPQDEAGILRATKTIHDLIEEEEKKGIPSNRIVLGGFSQGGALAMFSSLKFEKPLAGIVGLSCWLPLHTAFPKAMIGNKETPVFQCHGDSDPLVPPQYGAETSKLLKAMMSKVEFKTYKHMGHSSSDEELEDVKKFLNTVIPPV